MANDPVTRLMVDGKEIILIGTAHVSQQSAELVKKIIEEERPDSVCIELDEKRYDTIQNPKAWESTDIISVIKSKRVGFLLANLALSSYQKRIAQKLNVTVGAEMLQGIQSAKEVDAQLVLADRDIQTTFLRIWRKLSLWEKLKLISALIFSFDDSNDVSESDLQEMLEGDILESMLGEIRESFPKIGDILISERDQFLSHKIKNAPGDKVVAVLGGAHVPGVKLAIHQTIDVEAINTVPPKKNTGKILGWIIPAVIVGLLLYSFTAGVQAGLEQILVWILWNGTLAALCTLLVLGHPLSILTSFVVAPISSLNPFLAVGWFSGLVQATVQKPTVQDLHQIHDDITSVKGFFRNKMLKALLVVVFANIGSSIGTFIAGADIIQNLF
jgi:pheromone shutdown-related protein TraB